MAVELTKAASLLSNADGEYFLGFCDTNRITVPTEKRENTAALFRIVMRFLNSEQIENSTDGGKAIVDQVIRDLEEKEIPPLEENGEVKSEDLSQEDKKIRDGKSEVLVTQDEKKVVKVTPPETAVSETLSYHKFQKFKLDGKIGEPGEKDCLSYSSVSFQIRQGITQKYTISEFAYGIITAIKGGNPLRELFEMSETSSIEDILSILRSHYNEKDPSETFQELRRCGQNPGENAHAFVARAITLRKKVHILSQEEGKSFDAELLKSTFFQSIYTGIKQNNIRMELQSLLQTQTGSDRDLLSAVARASANEKERVDKSKNKVEINKVSADSDSDVDSSPQTNKSKKRERKMEAAINNLTAKVESLSTVTNEIAQLKQQIANPPPPMQQPAVGEAGAANVGNNGDQLLPQRRFQFRRPQRPIFRCEACNLANSPWCAHCFKCGSEEHKRAACPN